MEGTYPLPEAQLDRFLLKVLVPFPGAEVLRGIVQQTIQPPDAVSPVLDGTALGEMVRVARAIPIADPLVDYAVALISATHPEIGTVDAVRQFVRAGASPRGLQALVTCAQVRALLDGRFNVAVDDLRALAHPTLRHRVLLNFEGQAEGMTADAVVDAVLQAVPVP
jgi:MoxR-like ATPase